MVIVLKKKILAIAVLCVAVLIAVPFLVKLALPQTAGRIRGQYQLGPQFSGERKDTGRERDFRVP